MIVFKGDVMLKHIQLSDVRVNMANKEKNLHAYLMLMDWVRSCDVTQDFAFQTKYKGFWKVRGRGSDWCVPYFDYMESHKTIPFSFNEVLVYLFETTRKVEGSFGSKLLATLNPEKPIWDRIILEIIGIPQPKKGQKDKQKQIEESFITYSMLENWYDEYLETPNAKDVVSLIDDMFPFATSMTPVKKIDWALWSVEGFAR
jgi:hypothetical protein